MSKRTNLWKRKPAVEDFAAAAAYLGLLCSPARVRALVTRLRRGEIVLHEAKDLLRASHLPLLPRSEPHVKQDLKRLQKGKPLSPVLLVRGDLGRGFPLLVADGYHRICAAYYRDENAAIACRVAAA
jgi:hypothetical protein